MIQLFCLRCNRANDAESRFCSGCGTSLIRKFCPRCHVVNGADSHFCQACGAALPMPPAVEPVPPPHEVPSLTDAVEMSVMPQVAPNTLGPLWAAAPGGQVTVLSRPPAAGANTSRSWMSPSLLLVGALGVGAVIALAAAVRQWPTGNEHKAAAHADNGPRPAGRTLPPAEATVAGGIAVPVRDALAMTAGPRSLAVERPGINRTPPSDDGATAPAYAQAAPGAGRSPARAAAVATITPVGAARARPSKPAASAAAANRAPDCTPEVYALGLCAPGAKIIGRP